MDPLVISYGLILSCPYRYNNWNCPYNHLRQMPMSERLFLFRNLTSEEVMQMYEAHLVCVAINNLSLDK